MDAVVLSGLIAVMLGELVGTLAERVSGKAERHAQIVDGKQVLVSKERRRGK